MSDVSDSREKGTVKWFNEERGYGFIDRDDAEDDAFVHYSEVNVDDYVNLEEGDRLEFNIKQQDDGPAAVDVDVIQEASGSGDGPNIAVGGTK